MRSLNRRGQFLLGFIYFLSWILRSECSSRIPNLDSKTPRLNAPNDFLESQPLRTFELGIVKLDKEKYYLCIQYASPIDTAVVWVANRDNPLKSGDSFLKLDNGQLQLFDADSEDPVWSSETNNAIVAMLLDTGNLVLRDSNNQIVWESFKKISDTLLPGQSFNKSDNKTLTSWTANDDPKPGNYTFGWSTPGNASIVQLACQTCQWLSTWNTTKGVYIPAPDVADPHVISHADSMYFHDTQGSLYFPPSANVTSRLGDLPPAPTVIISDFQLPSNTTRKPLRRLRLDKDGGLRIWEWKDGTWTAVANWVVSERGSQCFTINTCGEFGVCKSAPGYLGLVECTCPKGFKAKYPADFSRGCQRKTPLSGNDFCIKPSNGSNRIKMLPVDGVGWGYDMPWSGDLGNYTNETDSSSCQASCSNDCNCTGVVYSSTEKRCWKKKGNLYNLGYPTVVLHGTEREAYIKIYENDVQDSKDRKLWILGAVLGGAFGIGVVICLAYSFSASLRRICGKVCRTKGTGRNDIDIPPWVGPANAAPQELAVQ